MNGYFTKDKILFTYSTSPSMGANTSAATLTDSIEPIDSPTLNFVPKSGNSIWTISPSSVAAC